MADPVEVDLEEGAENALPRLFNWSARFGGHDPEARVILVATTDPELGSEPHQRVRPPATMVSAPLDDASLLSLATAVQQALQVRRLRAPWTAN